MTDADASVAKPLHDRASSRRNGAAAAAQAKRLGLRLVAADTLSIRRRRCGKGWCYLAADGRVIRDRATVRRLAQLAVPPAYEEVLYAEDSGAHLQAVGRDAAGRLQYRYHPQWEKVREMRKARRLARLADVLPRIRRSIAQHLAGNEPTRQFTCAAVIELVARSAIRPGSESHARLRGTRGAATLLKSNVTTYGETITLSFRSKGGKTVVKESRRAAAQRCDHGAAAAAGPSAVPASRRHRRRAPGHRQRRQWVSARARGRAYLAQGLSHAAGFRERARDACAHRAGAERAPPPQAGARCRAHRRRHARQHAGDLPQELRARHRGGGIRGRRAGAVLADAQGLPLADPPRPGAGADHRPGCDLKNRVGWAKAHRDCAPGIEVAPAPLPIL